MFRLGDMTEMWMNGLAAPQKLQLYKASYALRSVAERAFRKRDKSFYPTYSYEDLEKMLAAPEPTVQEKLSLLLRYLGKNSQYPGQEITFDGANDYSIVCAQNSREAEFYLSTLAQQGFVRPEPPVLSPPGTRLTLLASGWNELNRLDRIGVESSSAFIAMAFSPDRDLSAKAIAAAIRAAGYLPIRVDQVEHINKIDDEIIARIRASKFLVADFTLQRNGVYFEAGFMLGLGRPVIWLCEKDDLKHVHFDTRQYNTIDYIDADDLQKRLQTRIEAILGKGPHSTSVV
jgi:nucleoside 2-deoxyribosyltransferase